MQERIISFMKAEGIGSGALADRIGVQRSGLSHILSGRNKPSYDFILKFLEAFPNVNAEWFITGRGKMYKESVQSELFHVEQEPGKGRKAPLQEQEMPETAKNVAIEGDKEEKEPDHAENGALSGDTGKGHIVKIMVLYDTGRFEEFAPHR